MSAPVPDPPLRRLPLGDPEFGWERFEGFCLAVTRAMDGVADADHYGNPGDSQDGIDLKAALNDGRRRGIQVRKRSQFGPAAAKRTVEEAIYQADEYEVWVSRPVSKQVTDYFDGLSNWLVRDQETISQLVRELPREVGHKLVDDHFGSAVGRAFFGKPRTWESTSAFFAPSDREDTLVRHDLPLVGRSDERDALVAAVEEDTVDVVLVIGRGGIGKTRILRAAADELDHKGERVLFARPGATLDQDATDDLPFVECSAFIDEADRSHGSLVAIVAAARERSPAVTVVMSIRPTGLFRIAEQIAAAGVEPRRVRTIGPLDRLDHEGSEALASAALGAGGQAAIRVAAATANTPLLTVLAGRLIASEDLLSEGMSVDEELRRTVLARFRNEQLGRVSEEVPEAAAKQLATILSALGAISDDHPQLLDTIATEMDIPTSRLLVWLGKLEEAGMLLRRGRLRRVMPEVLADDLLEVACIDPGGNPTGYVEELWRRYAPIAATDLLMNISALDWRTTESSGRLLESIRGEILREFDAADASGRIQLIEIYAPSAALQPETTLALCRRALADPARETDDGWTTTTDADVRRTLTQLLRAAGMHAEHFAEVAAILWQLGRDLPGELHATPDHPVRILRELADYQHPPSHQDALISLVEREIVGDRDEHRFSPVDLLDVLLSREEDSTISRGMTMSIHPFFVSADATAETRSRARGLLVAEALGDSPRRRLRAAHILGEALTLPRGFGGATVSREYLESWEGDQGALLDSVATIAAASEDLVVREELRRQVAWHQDDPLSEELTDRADELVDVLTGSATDLYGAIFDPWKGRHDHEEKEARDQRAAERLLENSSGAAIANALEEVLLDLEEHQVLSKAEPFAVMHAICQGSSDRASEIWQWARGHPTAHLTPTCAVALDAVKRAARTVCGELEHALDAGELSLRRAAALYLSLGAWFNDQEGCEEPALTSLVSDDDRYIASTAATAVLRLEAVDPTMAARVALAADPGSTDQDTLFSSVSSAGLDILGDNDIARLETQLVEVPDLGWGGWGALAALGAADPAAAVHVLVQRLQKGRSTDGYRPIPLHDYRVDLLPGSSNEQRAESLRALLTGSAGLKGWDLRELGKAFWRLAAPGLDHADTPEQFRDHRVGAEVGRTSLLALAREGDVEIVAGVLRETSWLVVLEDPAWVHDLLDGATDADATSLKGGLYSAIQGGGHSRQLGTDSPRLVETAERSEAAAAELQPGPTAEFFKAVERESRAQIEADRAQDEEIDSDWR